MASELTRRKFMESAGTLAAVGVGSAALSAQGAEAAPGAKIKVLAICASPRKGKTTATALNVCLEAAKAVSADIETELLELAGLSIPGEVAAGVALQPGQQDDFPSMLPKITDPRLGAIIFGTPVYFGNMSALGKAFLDRCIDIRKDKSPWSDKVAGVVAVGGARNGGQELTIASVQAVLLCHEMVIVGDGRPTSHRGATVWSGAGKEVTDDAFGMSTCKNLGRRVAEVALRMAR